MVAGGTPGSISCERCDQLLSGEHPDEVKITYNTWI